MADAKITQLTELTTPEGVDLLAIVDDVAGTPITKKVTLANLLVNRIAGASVATNESTSSTSYTDLATDGPSVTLTTGSEVLIAIYSQAFRSTGGNTTFISVAVSGATTLAAADGNGASHANIGSNLGYAMTTLFKLTGLTPGSNTFKIRYRCDGGAAFSFWNRRIVVIAIN